MTISTQWKKTNRKRKTLIFLGLGLGAVVAVILGLSMGENVINRDGGENAVRENSVDLTNCSVFINENPLIDANFTYEGLECEGCGIIGGEALLFGCDNVCDEFRVINDVLVPEQESCDILAQPSPEPVPAGGDFDCPSTTYLTHKQTGCFSKTIYDLDDLLNLFNNTLFLDSNPNIDLETCFETCENIPNCGGVVVGGEEVFSCYVFFNDDPEIVELCESPVRDQTVCTPIKDEIQCFSDTPVTFEAAESLCQTLTNGRLAVRQADDEFDIMLGRLQEACAEGGSFPVSRNGETPLGPNDGCFYEDASLEEGCPFVANDLFFLDPDCNDIRGFCCETETQSPTTSPTASPTERLFFVPEDCLENETFSLLNFTEAAECCERNNADLAAIHSQAEQDFAYEICLDVIQDEDNDCGCWIGLERDLDEPNKIDPFTYFFTDGSGFLGQPGNLFNGFEQAPEIKPDNQDGRNEACVHMRPFSDGGWNDLPCDGNCDARDTKPLPLCRLRTPAPTTSPTRNPTNKPTTTPTFSPTNKPTTSPTVSPTVSPTRSPTVSPTRNPTVSPTVSPTKNPTESPTVSPTRNPTTSPTESPTVSPTKNPTTSPTVSPTKNPTVSPTESPTTSPTVSPTRNPTTSPTVSPTTSPTKNPTTSPTTSPTVSPTKNPTTSPTESPTTSPTVSPTKNPTTSPTTSPTVSPTRNPTTSPTESPTRNPTTSPTKNPTRSPTFEPTESPTKNPTRSPTVSPTRNPTTSPTESPTRNPTTSPTKNPTESPTTSPTDSPTASPTTSPTVSPTRNPTTSPTRSPTENPTKNPTASPTRNPTVSPTRNPTTSPTESPTASPTDSPTASPTESPTVSPTRNPTKNPTESPTVSPTKSPTDSPTVNPTVSPTVSPTRNPTTSPTESPTSNPTVSPTFNPTQLPTISPIGSGRVPLPLCKLDGEFLWSVTNDHPSITIPFSFHFAHPEAVPNPPFDPLGISTIVNSIPADPEFYNFCNFPLCFSFQFFIPGGETFIFRSPVPVIIAKTIGFDEFGNFVLIETELEFPQNAQECICEEFTFFQDDFEDYPVINGISSNDSALFFDRYEVGPGTVDVKGFIRDENGTILIDNEDSHIGLAVSSDFFFNPCRDEQCIDIDGTVEFDFLDENNLSIREINIAPDDAFFNRICTLNFFIRGNSRCGILHDNDDDKIRNPTQAFNSLKCIQYYANELVPLEDNLTVTMTENGNEIASTFFPSIPWDQEFEPYGITGDVQDGATSVGGTFTIFGGEFLETGLNIGPLLDDVDYVCCCPDSEARFVGRIIETEQGPTEEGSAVPVLKSDPVGLIGHIPSYSKQYQYSLGLGGFIVIEFTLGASDKIIIYEESYICCGKYDPEDAIIEVSVDGIQYFTVAATLRDTYVPVEGGDYLRKTEIHLPNGACFKFVKITDNSDPSCKASDGFDLVSIEVVKPCCPAEFEPLPTAAPTPEVEDIVTVENFVFGGEVSTGGAAMFTIAAVLVVLLGALVVLTVQQQKDDASNVAAAQGVEVEKDEEGNMKRPVSKDDLKRELTSGPQSAIDKHL